MAICPSHPFGVLYPKQHRETCEEERSRYEALAFVLEEEDPERFLGLDGSQQALKTAGVRTACGSQNKLQHTSTSWSSEHHF